MHDGIKNRDASPSSSRSVTTTVNGSHNFVIWGYSLAKGMGFGRHISSDTFAVGGYQWAIYFYPDGEGGGDNSLYVSAFVALVSGGTDVRAFYELTLVDQSGNGEQTTFHSHLDPGSGRGPYIFKERGSMWGYKQFFRRDVLETSDYIKDDCLKLKCTLRVIVTTRKYARLRKVAVPESELGLHFGTLLENQETSDVTFDVAGTKFCAHKVVLAARSPVFRTKFFGSSEQNNEVVITEVEPTVFKAILHYIYRDTLLDEEPSSPNSFSETLTERLLAAADVYGLTRLRLLCESKLSRNISVHTVASTLALAESCHATDLKVACLKFAARNLVVVMRTKGFEYLKEKYPLLHSEILSAVAGFEDDCSSGESGSSVWAQISGGTDIMAGEEDQENRV